MSVSRNHLDSQGGLVLVAGAGGFIGRRLIEILHDARLPVLAVRRGDCDLRRPGDTRALVEKHHPGAIINLARPTHAADPDSSHDGHAEIAANLLAAARSAGICRLIQLGSSTEFGEAEPPVEDDAPLRPTTSFGKAKAEASSLVLAANGDEVRTAVLRAFSVYGPGDRPRHLIPTAIRAALSRGTVRLARSVVRDWVFVDDVARACVLALDGRVDGAAVNLASGVGVPNERVVALVEEIAERPIPIDPEELPPRRWDAGLVGATERSRRLLRWMPRTGLIEGIRMTIAAEQAAHSNTPIVRAR